MLLWKRTIDVGLFQTKSYESKQRGFVILSTDVQHTCTSKHSRYVLSSLVETSFVC
uniref:AlNc14C58G4350 protein n=1 Tax=Albugo laibachii Nc14 TaxID=890382 RepID=F0WCH1_9STRA|nr:AlNc14C58G4350 [Albugo laibachii Nc14]|eukprot:CCA18886.1 AlNc14C58G4350 [Albugo laibachii Nc14]